MYSRVPIDLRAPLTRLSMVPSFPLSLLLVILYTTQQGPTESALLLPGQSHFPGTFESHGFRTLFPFLALYMAFSGVILLSAEDQSCGS